MVAVESIEKQLRRADELVVVDQSTEPLDRDDLARCDHVAGTAGSLVYIHDTHISGLIHAKHVGSRRATGDIVCFLEDDIVLEPEYLAQIEASFRGDAGMQGASGVVTNTPRPGSAYVFFHELFHRGVFDDPRPRVYGNLERLKSDPNRSRLIPSHALSGGISAWRRGVFERVPFDLATGFHMLEDIDFSTRVQREYGPCLYINPRARLAHHFAPAGRDTYGRRESRKVQEFFKFHRKHRRDWRDSVALAWLLLGIGLSSAAFSLRHLTFKPIVGFFSGIRAGMRHA